MRIQFENIMAEQNIGWKDTYYGNWWGTIEGRWLKGITVLFDGDAGSEIR